MKENEVDFRGGLRYNYSIEMDKLINLFASKKVFGKLCTRLAYSCDEGIINSILLETIYYRISVYLNFRWGRCHEYKCSKQYIS